MSGASSSRDPPNLSGRQRRRRRHQRSSEPSGPSSPSLDKAFGEVTLDEAGNIIPSNFPFLFHGTKEGDLEPALLWRAEGARTSAGQGLSLGWSTGVEL